MQLLSSNVLSGLIHFKIPSLQRLGKSNNYFALSKKGIFLEQWFSARSNFAHRGHLVMPGNIFDYHNWVGRDVTDI